MFRKADNSAGWTIAGALILFFTGGLPTTIAPPLIDTSWTKPFENNDPSKGPTGKLRPPTALEQQGRMIYVREGCWYCHTMWTRTLLSYTKRSGGKGGFAGFDARRVRLRLAAPVRNEAHWTGSFADPRSV